MEMKTQEVKQRKVSKSKEFIPFLFGQQLKPKELDKLDLFEKGLSNEILKTDTIEQAVTRIVRMAIASEFGASFVKARGAENMVRTIVTGILSDGELRKQALLIIDRYARD